MLRNLLVALVALSALPAFAQYNKSAGMNAPAPASVRVETKRSDGRVEVHTEQREAPRDGYGNAQGNQYDLAVDGAFEGQTVLVVDLYGQDFSRAAAAIKEKGFSVVRYSGVPPLEEFQAALKKSNQFWILASCDNSVHLSKAHQAAVQRFFTEGHGVYLWGDNDPCNADADVLARQLVEASVEHHLKVSAAKGKGEWLTIDHDDLVRRDPRAMFPLLHALRFAQLAQLARDVSLSPEDVADEA